MRLSAIAFAIALIAGFSSGQDRPVRNPREGNPEAIRAGARLYDARCSTCHGVDAKGVQGPDLTILWASGAGDDRLFQTVRRGVAGTEMPANNVSADEIWAILAYLRSLNTTIPVEYSKGDAAKGQQIFSASCAACHQVNGRGGRLGPDLSRIGASRSRAALAREIRTPSASMAAGYQPVRLVTANGQQIRGIRKNEDAFSIQIMDTAERLQGYLKADLRNVALENQSLMPEYGAGRLGESDLDDLLRFLSMLRGTNSNSR